MTTTSKFDAIYQADGFSRDDIAAVKPNMLFVSGIPPPETSASGLALPHRSSVPGTACLMFRVEAVGPIDKERWGSRDSSFPHVDVGDVVIPRVANLDPISTNKRPLFALDVRDVLGIVSRASTDVDAGSSDA